MVSMWQLLADAMRRGYAACYCEAWNLESLQAVLQGADECRSPVIAGFNGGFLAHPGRSEPENLAWFAGLAGALRAASVPVAFLLNETDSPAQIEQGMALGFNAVMVERESLSLEEYQRFVKTVVELAHPRDVWVEAQVGRLPNGSDGVARGELTDPLCARVFVRETGIDGLAVSIGNVHVLTSGEASIDLEALRRIRAAVDVPLVIHGGTGLPLRLAKDVIRLGVAKVNYGTILKQAYLAALREKLGGYREPLSPHPFLGMGGPQDILVAGREAVKRKVKELLQAYGSAGKAAEVQG